MTLRRLMADGSLGELRPARVALEHWRPRWTWTSGARAATPEDAGGLLYDLGPHLIDQAVELLGPVRSVYAEVRGLRPGAKVDDDVFLALEHGSGARWPLWAGNARRPARPAPPGARLAGRVREVGA